VKFLLLKDQHGIHIEFLVWYRDMAFIGIKVPQEVAEKLSTIEVPGERSDPDEMHITLGSRRFTNRSECPLTAFSFVTL
jgi:hypothetical protein